MSTDHDTPPVGEEIHLPGPTFLPVACAAGITLMVIGTTINWWISIAGLILFTVQHNFEHSYASADEGWDRDEAALRGTSFLVLPKWLNWITADAAFLQKPFTQSMLANKVREILESESLPQSQPLP